MIEQWACNGGIQRVWTEPGGRVVVLETPSRVFSAHQRRAIAARDGNTCVIPHCTIPALACEAHHVTAWALGGKTVVDNGVLLCWSHHRTIENGYWAITMRHGRPVITHAIRSFHPRSPAGGNNPPRPPQQPGPARPPRPPTPPGSPGLRAQSPEAWGARASTQDAQVRVSPRAQSRPLARTRPQAHAQIQIPSVEPGSPQPYAQSPVEPGSQWRTRSPLLPQPYAQSPIASGARPGSPGLPMERQRYARSPVVPEPLSRPGSYVRMRVQQLQSGMLQQPQQPQQPQSRMLQQPQPQQPQPPLPP
ncbi:HNH endonuclease signature motif containing protein [Rarobacter incanus]